MGHRELVYWDEAALMTPDQWEYLARRLSMDEKVTEEHVQHTEVETPSGAEAERTDLERTVTEPVAAQPEPGVDTPVAADPDLTANPDETKAAQ